MKKPIAMTAIASALFSVCAPHSTRADITESLHLKYTGPVVDQIQKQGKGNPFDQFAEMRIYMSPKQFRVNIGPLGIIANMETKKVVTLNNTAHTYTEKDFDPAQSKNLLGDLMGTKSVYTNVIDTGKTSEYMGHQVRHYTADITATSSRPELPPNMRTMNITIDILAAQDMPQENQEMLAKYNVMLGTPAEIKGLGLMMRSTYTSGFLNGTVLNMNATAVSTKPIDASAFDIPTGFTKAETKPAGAAPATGA